MIPWPSLLFAFLAGALWVQVAHVRAQTKAARARLHEHIWGAWSNPEPVDVHVPYGKGLERRIVQTRDCQDPGCNIQEMRHVD